ncbi:hypothetical protein C8J57DRAFT_1259698 [Mycena rebaudengoi]|nr:hypothetical protein C8J57DRAFT_1259698 [Mycena rebaudengoi]
MAPDARRELAFAYITSCGQAATEPGTQVEVEVPPPPQKLYMDKMLSRSIDEVLLDAHRQRGSQRCIQGIFRDGFTPPHIQPQAPHIHTNPAHLLQKRHIDYLGAKPVIPVPPRC